MKAKVVSWISRAARVVAILLVAVFAMTSCVPFSGRPMPDIRGRETVTPGPAGPVEIVRDQNGIAHITAATRNDAYFGQGYAHAQDRFFQMEFWRRIGQGRLSELFGAGVLPSDIYLRTMGFDRIAQAEYEAAPGWMRDALESYADGVNAYIADKKPGQLSFEFSLLKVQGVEVEIDPWTPGHSLAWVKVMAQDLGSDMSRELLRLDVIRSVGIDMAKDYFAPIRYDEFPTILLDEELPVRSTETTASEWLSPSIAGLGISMIPQDVSSAVIAGRDQARSLGLGYGLGTGSNSWVVSGDHTESGKPILSNDPHLGIQMPSIWYEVSLHYAEPDGHEVNIHGFSFAGVPGVVIGHNNDIAWGLSVGYADEQDLYIERINPSNPDQYLVGDEWHDMEVRVERIIVSKEDEPVFVTVRATRNGPIVTDHGGYAPYGGFFMEPIQLFPTDMQLSALALKWTALEPGTTLQSVLQINEAESFDEFRESLRLWSGPSQGIVCADVLGNIGYQLPGSIPVRGAGTGALPAPGWDDDYQWQGFIPFDEMPWVKNPERGFVVAANNPATSSAYPHVLSHTLVSGYRALRITEMLTELLSEGGLTSGDMAEMQLDTYNLSASEILSAVAEVPVGSIEKLLEPEFVLFAEIPEDEDIAERVEAAGSAIELLSSWDHLMDPESAGAAVFTRFFVELFTRVFEDEFTPEFWETGRPIGGASDVQNRLELLLRDPDNLWWDNEWTTDHRESRDEILAQALAAAYMTLVEELGNNPQKWEWSEIHGATFRNQTLGESGIGIIENMFNRGPYGTPGGLDQVRRSGIELSEPEEVSSVSSLRMVLDLADWSSGLFVHTTGQSGHIRSPHYDDFIDEWLNGEYFVHPWTDEEIDAASRQRLILE